MKYKRLNIKNFNRFVNENIESVIDYTQKLYDKYGDKYPYSVNEEVNCVGDIWYHGSNVKFDSFKLKQGTLFDADYISPIFLTSNINFAKYYAGNGSQYLYKVKVLSENIMDFRKLPSTYELLMYRENGELNSDIELKFYEIGESLLENIEDIFPDEDCDRKYNNLLDGDYSSIEQTYIYDWLKKNNYDGAYIIETKELNLLIFDESKLKIISVEKLS